MNKLFLPLLGVMTLTSSLLLGDFGTQDIDLQDLGASEIVTDESDRNPFKIDFTGDYIGKADVEHSSRNVVFATAIGEVNFVYYYNELYKEGASVGLLYEHTYLNYHKNPFFSQKNFDTVILTFSTFTERLCNWEWRAQLSINFDDVPYWNFNDYMNYDMLAWGRYAYSNKIGLHIGILAQTGMKVDRVYPILGFDWTYNEHWRVDAIFPMNVSLTYTINKAWNMQLAGRFINQRHRTRSDEPLSKAIWCYQGGGAEFGVNFNPYASLSINVHAGYSFGAHLKIANHNYHRLERLSINGSPYGGGELVYRF